MNLDRCLRCDRAVRIGARFCGHCGAPRPSTAPPVLPPTARTLGPRLSQPAVRREYRAAAGGCSWLMLLIGIFLICFGLSITSIRRNQALEPAFPYLPRTAPPPHHRHEPPRDTPRLRYNERTRTYWLTERE